MKTKINFYTDVGEVRYTDMQTGEELRLPRYGAWGDAGKGKPEVVETSDDLSALQKKYGSAPLYTVSKPRDEFQPRWQLNGVDGTEEMDSKGLEEFLAANEDLDEYDANTIRNLPVGRTFADGGGAAPEWSITRLA